MNLRPEVEFVEISLRIKMKEGSDCIVKMSTIEELEDELQELLIDDADLL